MKCYSVTIPKASLANPGILSLDKQYISGNKIFHITPDTKNPTDPNKIKPAITILTGDLKNPLHSYRASNIDKGVIVVKESEDSDFEIMSVKTKGPTKFHNGIIIDRIYEGQSPFDKYYGKDTCFGYFCIRDRNCNAPPSMPFNMYSGIHSESEDKIRKPHFLHYAKLEGNNSFSPSPDHRSLDQRIVCYGASVKEPNPKNKSYFFTAMMGDDSYIGGLGPGINVFSVFSDQINDKGLSSVVKEEVIPPSPSANVFISGFLYGGRVSIRAKRSKHYIGENDFTKRAGIDWLTNDIPGLAINRNSDGNIAIFSSGFNNTLEKRMGVLDSTVKYGLRFASVVWDSHNNTPNNYPNRTKPNYEELDKTKSHILNNIWSIFNKIKTYYFIKNGADPNSKSSYTYNFYPSEVKQNYEQAFVAIEGIDENKKDTGIAYSEFIPLLWEAVNDLNERLKKLEQKRN